MIFAHALTMMIILTIAFIMKRLCCRHRSGHMNERCRIARMLCTGADSSTEQCIQCTVYNLYTTDT
jgi:hypothetical protein